MKVVHWAPFAPGRCGLYEAARDCAYADTLRDHEVLFCDTGVCPKPGVREDPRIGAHDLRGGWPLRTADPSQTFDADLWVCHDGVKDAHSARCQVPMIWMVHGRPAACFRPEQVGKPGRPYSIIADLAKWPRVKALVTMWSEFVPHWELMAKGKLRCTVDPPLDARRFRPEGPKRTLTDPGVWNLLICDSWRDDLDVYEVAVAAYCAAKRSAGIKVHFWAVEEWEGAQVPWQHLWSALSDIGALGEIHPRETEFDSVYRAMDMLVTPHTIGVRTIMEALSCGIPVVAAEGCRYTPYTGRLASAKSMALAIQECLEDLGRGQAVVDASPFDLDVFGERMEKIYREAVGEKIKDEKVEARRVYSRC